MHHRYVEGKARTTHKIPVRGSSSFKACLSNNISSINEEKTIQNNGTLRNAGQAFATDSQDNIDKNAVAMQWNQSGKGYC